jgi:hypothetical protein
MSEAKSNTLRRLVRRVLCFVQGHPCQPTGRTAILLTEWVCQRCGGTFVSHKEHGNALVPGDPDSDRIFRDWMDAIKTSSCTPNTALKGADEGGVP